MIDRFAGSHDDLLKKWKSSIESTILATAPGTEATTNQPTAGANTQTSRASTQENILTSVLQRLEITPSLHSRSSSQSTEDQGTRTPLETEGKYTP